LGTDASVVEQSLKGLVAEPTIAGDTTEKNMVIPNGGLGDEYRQLRWRTI